MTAEVAVRPAEIRRMRDTDVPAADRVMRAAFGTYLGLPRPDRFAGDAQFVATRSRAAHTAAYVAELDDEVVGSSLVTRWGSFAIFGPLTVAPSHWDSGIGKQLMEPIADQLDAWGVELAGLFTFPGSAKHIGLYQRYGFYPRALTALMQLPLNPAASVTAPRCLSDAPPEDAARLLRGIGDVCAAVYDGLDLGPEIAALGEQRLGDVVIVGSGDDVEGFAVCHLGAGSEAGTGTCYLKFAAVRPGPGAGAGFARLLTACERLAIGAGASTLLAGVNTARQHAHDAMWSRGYRPAMYGIAMHRPNNPGFSGATDYVIDDWR